METDNIATFKQECRDILHQFPIQELYTFARTLNMRKPTTSKKADLIEDVLLILCGEMVQTRVNSGKPAKNRHLNLLILWEINRLIESHQIPNLLPAELLNPTNQYVTTVEPIKITKKKEPDVKTMKDTAEVVLPSEGSSPCVRIVVFPSKLKKRQKQLLFDFLNSL